MLGRKLWWERLTPSERESYFHQVHKGLAIRPSGFEQQIIALCSEYGLPFEYVGNGKFWVGRLNPDFVCHKYKLLIETHNSYFDKYLSSGDYRTTRNLKFLEYGYTTLFLDENDLKNPNWVNICLTKIREVLDLC